MHMHARHAYKPPLGGGVVIRGRCAELRGAGLQGTAAYYRPPYHNLRHPMVFYYGHPAALYVNKLRVAGLVSGPVNELFEHIFETGVDEMAWDDLSKNDMLWPMARSPPPPRRAYVAWFLAVLAKAQWAALCVPSPGVHPLLAPAAREPRSPYQCWAVGPDLIEKFIFLSNDLHNY